MKGRLQVIIVPDGAELEASFPDAQKAPGSIGKQLRGFSIWRCTCGRLRAGGMRCPGCLSTFDQFEAAMRAFRDYWIRLDSERDGKPTWHRFRHIPSGAGGTYGWWQICGPLGQGPFVGHQREDSRAQPEEGERVCRRCKSGRARWQEAAEA